MPVAAAAAAELSPGPPPAARNKPMGSIGGYDAAL